MLSGFWLMNTPVCSYYRLQDLLISPLRHLDGLAPLALRLYLAPVLWIAGTQKITHMNATVEWFGNADWGLGLPIPGLLAHLAAYTEIFGAVALLLGLAVRWFSILLMVVMAVAAATVHWQHGWATIADIGVPEIAVRLGVAREILEQHGNYRWLIERGNFVIFNNGIELAVTYFVMLLSLLFSGGGRFVSLDYYLSRLYPPPISVIEK